MVVSLSRITFKSLGGTTGFPVGISVRGVGGTRLGVVDPLDWEKRVPKLRLAFIGIGSGI